MIAATRVAFFACAFLVTLVLAHAREPSCEVNVNTTLTDAGRKLSPPTREHPAYYFPLVAGWREEGALVAGEKPPSTVSVVHELARALAANGYVVVGPKTPQPTVLLVFHWGYMNPEIEDSGPNDPTQQVFFNQNEMLALVAGDSLRGFGTLDLNSEREAVMQGAKDNRYFVVVTAYDFADARKKKKTKLWIARMSTPTAGFTMSDVVPALIKSGGPLFGRETVRPEWVSAKIIREGTVEVGTPTVVPDATAKPADPPKK